MKTLHALAILISIPLAACDRPPSSLETATAEPIRTPAFSTELPTPSASRAKRPSVTHPPLSKWQEFEIALCKAFFGSGYISGYGLCEWEFLGQSGSDVYINALCRNTSDSFGSTMRSPTVISLGSHGEIGEVVIPRPHSYSEDLRRLFPPNVLAYLAATGENGWEAHIESRRKENAPPLIAVIDRSLESYLVNGQEAHTTPESDLLPFHVQFDTQIWEWKTIGDYFVLAHQRIPGCNISLTSGRGLSPQWRVEHSEKILGALEYSVNEASHLGELRIVNYCFTGEVSNCFMVEFQSLAQA